MICQNCGAEVKENDRFCGKCGTEVSGSTIHLEKESSQQTQQTYYQQQPYQTIDTRKSKLVAGILQIVLGWAGVGRFYLGYNSVAIAQILVSFFTCGLGAIWPFIDGILILVGQVPTDADGVPLKD